MVQKLSMFFKFCSLGILFTPLPLSLFARSLSEFFANARTSSGHLLLMVDDTLLGSGADLALSTTPWTFFLGWALLGQTDLRGWWLNECLLGASIWPICGSLVS